MRSEYTANLALAQKPAQLARQSIHPTAGERSRHVARQHAAIRPARRFPFAALVSVVCFVVIGALLAL